MRKISFFATVFLFVIIPSNVLGKALYFPHFAEGKGWKSWLTITNSSINPTVGKATFYSPNGTPQVLPLASGSADHVDLTLKPYETVTISSTGASSSLLTGYVIVDMDQEDVSALLRFQYRNGAEVSVFPQSPGKKFSLPVENFPDITYGIAVAFQTAAKPLALSLYDTQGNLAYRQNWSLSGKQDAKTLEELFPQLADFQGLLSLESEGLFTCLGLRFYSFNAPTTSVKVFSISAIPVFGPRAALGPSITITSPTTSPTYTTTSPLISLSGTATNDVVAVKWSNDRGGNGTASGTSSWSASGIALLPGINVLTVTVTDTAGNEGQVELAVAYMTSTSTILSVTASCSPATIQYGQTSQCTATVGGIGNFSKAVTWSASAGSITTGGIYTPPDVNAGTQVTIAVTSIQDISKSGSTTVTVQPKIVSNSDIVVRGIAQVDHQFSSFRYVDILVQNVGSSTYCSINSNTPYSTSDVWLPAVKGRTYARNDGYLCDDCLRPGDFGVIQTSYILSIPLLTPADLSFEGTKSTVYAPDPQLEVVSVGPPIADNYPYTVKLANQSQKTAGNIRGKAILWDATGNFLGLIDLQDGYPNAFPMGDDRCMTTDDTLATYNCIKGGRTKDFGIQNDSGYNWTSVASIQVLPTWQSLAGKEILFPPTSYTTIHLTALSGAWATGKFSYGADAVFERDGTVFFNGIGGGYGERGINVAAIDPRTGVILELKSYDTWAESNAGDRLVSFLSSLPAGTIIMMAVADEGSSGLSTASRSSITQLVGSQQIKDLGYWDNWALVSAIGQTTPFAEELVPYSSTGTRGAQAEYNVFLP
jgi:hypothetical protein